jgi:FKBP-type peptidyl-prolyl cis-trans isomerase
MSKFLTFLLLTSILFSCNFSGVKEDVPQDVSSDDLTETTNAPTVQDSLIFENGIVIKFIQHGTGDSIRKGDVVMIDYSAKLEDGKVFDTNKKIGKPIPFMVGWLMQTKGWDFAFQHLRVGDEVEIFLPATMARGAAGIPGSVPPNAANFIHVSVVSKREADMTIDGVQVFVFERESDAKKVKVGDELDLDYIAYSESKPRYSSSFENGTSFRFKVGSGSNLPGLNMAIENAYYDDMLWILIPSKHAFGSKGSVNNVKPNESVLFDVLISERVY